MARVESLGNEETRDGRLDQKKPDSSVAARINEPESR